MAKTVADLQVGVRVYLDESSQADFLAGEVIRSINYAYHDVVTRVMTVYRQYYETLVPFSYALVANQQEYVIETTMISVARVEVNFAPQIPNSVPIRATAIKMDEDLLNIANSAASGSVFSAGYYLHGPILSQKIGLVPIPQQSDTTGKSLTVWGIFCLLISLIMGMRLIFRILMRLVI